MAISRGWSAPAAADTGIPALPAEAEPAGVSIPNQPLSSEAVRIVVAICALVACADGVDDVGAVKDPIDVVKACHEGREEALGIRYLSRHALCRPR